MRRKGKTLEVGEEEAESSRLTERIKAKGEGRLSTKYIGS